MLLVMLFCITLLCVMELNFICLFHYNLVTKLLKYIPYTRITINILYMLYYQSWERDSIPSRSTMKVKRTLPQGGNLYIDPPVYRENTISESKDFDDLLYALKTGGSFTPSDINSEDSDNRSEVSSKIDKYELRRIDIADTHL